MAPSVTTPPSMEVALSLEHVGARIAEARKERRLTQRCVAELLGVGTQVIAHIEQGRDTVQIGHYARAAWLLEVRGLLLVQYLTPDSTGET